MFENKEDYDAFNSLISQYQNHEMLNEIDEKMPSLSERYEGYYERNGGTTSDFKLENVTVEED